MKVLITGFDKFGGDSINPSELAVNMLPNKIDNIDIIKLILPTVFNDNYEFLKNTIAKQKPNILIHVGQAGGSKNIRIERIAINIDDARIPDNNGSKPIDKKIKVDGDTAYFATLPIKSIVKNLTDNNIPAEVSNSAGTFVCNHTMYQSLYLADKYFPTIKTGFVHIPYIPEQVANKPNMPSMDLDTIVQALKNIITIAVKHYHKNDIAYSDGKIY